MHTMERREVTLTEREKQILNLIWNGLTSREIGSEIGISVKTVEAHRGSIMKKLRCSNVAQLIALAIQGGHIKVRRNAA